jgi:hypothetical protein
MPTIKSRDHNEALVGAGSQRFRRMANDALARARVAPWCDPVLIPIGLGRTVRALTHADERASLVGRCLSYLWVPSNLRLTGLHLLLGSAIIVFEDEGIPRPSPADVARLAGYLALPDHRDVSSATELTLQVHAPLSFLVEHQRRRRWTGSGTYAAVR